MAVPFTKFITRKWAVLTSKIDKLFIVIGIIDNAVKKGGSRLQGDDIKEYIETNFNVTYQKTNIYHLLHELNLSWITTRSMHPKQSIEAQETFKKIPNRNDP